MNEFLYIPIWILGLIILGLINFPITFIIFNNLKDRGYAFSKTLFLLLVSLGVWLCGFLKIIEINYLLWIFFIIVIMANIIIFLKKKEEIIEFIKQNIKYILIIEFIFLASFLILIFKRSYCADIINDEKFMDMMLLATINRSAYMQ